MIEKKELVGEIQELLGKYGAMVSVGNNHRMVIIFNDCDIPNIDIGRWIASVAYNTEEVR